MRKKVFISGVTGTLGGAGLKHLLEHREKLEMVTIVRPSKKNKKEMSKYKSDDIEIVWGDLTNYKDVKKALKGVEYILHVAALVSPKADSQPEKAWAVNVGSTKNILRAIKELGLFDAKLIYIGSIAETGDRLPPIHWGRVGDPIKPSIYDHYAVTKIAAERLVIESGLKYWVSLRQTGILHFGLVSLLDGIIFHQPLNNVLEWVTADDSGRLLLNICIKDLPDKFWKNIYNIGGGASCRKNNYEFTSMMLETIGVKNIEKIFKPNWFANRNFHGQYYLDSHILNDYLNFRTQSIEDFIKELKKEVKFPITILRYLPDFFIKNIIMRSIARLKNSTLGWIKNKEQDKIDSYFGSLTEWKKIGSWKEFNIHKDYSEVIILDHGYDELKDESLLSLDDMKKVAEFRGGKCVSNHMTQGDLEEQLEWVCAFSHKFKASPTLVLKAGHWCEKCEAPPWNHKEIAKRNPFFKQVIRDDDQ